MTSDPTRKFPMLDGPSITWEIAEEIYKNYSARYGTSQSLERLAERGGFGWGEVEIMFRSRGKLRVAEKEKLQAKELHDAAEAIRPYFRSGNSTPVERATIPAEKWRRLDLAVGWFEK